MSGVPDARGIESCALMLRLLGNRRRLKILHACALALAEGREGYESKHELVRHCNRLFGERETLNDLNYDIERMVRANLLERRENDGVILVSKRVRLRICGERLHGLLQVLERISAPEGPGPVPADPARPEAAAFPPRSSPGPAAP